MGYKSIDNCWSPRYDGPTRAAKNTDKYQEIDNNIAKEYRKVKKEWLKDNCEKIEYLNEEQRHNEMFTEI